MKKPKYYLKPYWEAFRIQNSPNSHSVYGLSNDLWEIIRKENNKPVESSSNSVRIYQKYPHRINWHLTKRYLTQRYFMELKEEQSS